MVDVRAAEADHVGNQPVRIMQLLVGGQRDGGIAVPAEGFQCLGDKLLGRGLVQATIAFGLFDQRNRLLGEDVAPGQDLRGLLAQPRILDQLQPQQRAEHPERIARQRGGIDRTERSGMHRHPGHGQVVITHREHAHHRKHPAQHRQLGRGADADRAMPLQVNPLQVIGTRQRLRQRRVLCQHAGIDRSNQLHQVTVQRYLGAIHLGHRLGKQAANVIG